MKFARIVLLLAGIYGLLILTPIYFIENEIGRDTPPAIAAKLVFHLVVRFIVVESPINL